MARIDQKNENTSKCIDFLLNANSSLQTIVAMVQETFSKQNNMSACIEVQSNIHITHMIRCHPLYAMLFNCAEW